MDLYAYAQIGDLSGIMKENGISVPRLRGLRLMQQEEPMSKEEIDRVIEDRTIRVAENEFRRVAPDTYEYSRRTDKILEKYLVHEDVPYEWNGKIGTSREPVGIRWWRIHGRRRKKLRFAIKQARRAEERQWEAWNRYAGHPGVLYIHARIGGLNWKDYDGPELEKQPWFLEKVDDAFDDTYCDIYAKIKGPEM